MSSSQLVSWLESQKSAALTMLERMVGINSHTENPGGVNELGALTADFFSELGFTAETVPSTEPKYGSHLFLCRGPRRGQQVVLVTHLDTVFPEEIEKKYEFAWSPDPDGNRIYGPGTVDIKGGTVLIWMMLRALRQFYPELFEATSWFIAANASEEEMASDFGERTKERCPDGAKAVLVFEGGPVVDGKWQVVTSRKGRAVYDLKAVGKEAHAGSAHDKGKNAIVELSKVIPGIAALTDYAKDLTVNIGVIHGGVGLNTVPGVATAALEMRAYDTALLVATGEKISSIVEQADGVTVSRRGLSPDWRRNEATDALVPYWQAAAEELGLPLQPGPRGGLSDANYLWQLGPTLDGLGPSGFNSHCAERSTDGTKVPEFVEANTLVPKAALNVLALVRLLTAR